MFEGFLIGMVCSIGSYKHIYLSGPNHIGTIEIASVLLALAAAINTADPVACRFRYARWSPAGHHQILRYVVCGKIERGRERTALGWHTCKTRTLA